MDLREYFEDLAVRHKKAMKEDRAYRARFYQMEGATETLEHDRHYDREGYCDNPTRGY